jgi:hypothetical protein
MHVVCLWPSGGNPGKDVPTVAVADLKSVWSSCRDMGARGKQFAVNVELMRDACSAGADVGAVWYRCAMLEMLGMLPRDLDVPWRANEELPDAAFKVAATIPMKWIRIGIPESVLPFDVAAFLQRVREEST